MKVKRRKKVHIDKNFCETTEYTGQMVTYLDDVLIGFGLRVQATKKSFIYQFKQNRKKVIVTFGSYPKMNVAQARKLTKKEQGKAVHGTNSNIEKREQESRSEAEKKLTLRTVWIEYRKTKPLAESTEKEYGRFLDTYLEQWSDLSLNSITRPMVVAKFKEVQETSPSRANHCFRFLRAIYNFSQQLHLDKSLRPRVLDNPVKVISAMKLWSKHIPRTGFIPQEKLRLFFEKLESFSGTRAEDFRDFVKLLLFLGLRRNEGLNLKWVDVDLEDYILFARETKNHRDHGLPFGDLAHDILSKRSQRKRKHAFVFAGRGDGAASEYKDEFKELSISLGFHISAHDLRRTFATYAESLGLSDRKIRRLMNHKTKSLTDEYIQLTIDKLRGPIQKIESFIVNCLTTKN